jgi:hypothetical protein
VASAGNIGALLAVRDRPEGNGMANHAAKALETMLDQTSERRMVERQHVPGLQIRQFCVPLLAVRRQRR